MRRIDLFCKLAGPLFIALIDGGSRKVAIFVALGMNVLSVPVEYYAIAYVCFASKISSDIFQALMDSGLQSRARASESEYFTTDQCSS